MRRVIFAAIMILALWAFPFAAYAAEDDLGLTAQAYVLLDGNSGQTVCEKNSDQRLYPASTTKIMTLVLAMEALNNGKINLDDQVTTSKEAASMGGSQVYLFEGETRSVREMIIAIAVGSGNDASVAMAEFIAGSNQGFIKMMNEKARQLGMSGTNFTNAHGLHDENHYTTAADLAKLSFCAINTPGLLEYTTIYEYDFRPEPKPLKLWNTNRLLKWYDGCKGLKTGYTPEAGRNLASVVDRDGTRLISVVMGVEEAKGHFTESMKLLNYGFNTYQFKRLYETETVISEIPVAKGRSAEIKLVVKSDVGCLLKKGDDQKLSVTTSVPTELEAPFEAGQVAGKLELLANGKQVAVYNLVTKEAVARGSMWGTWKKFFTCI